MRKYLLATVLMLATAVPVNATQAGYSNKELDCMARTLYHEARGESERGMIMVAEVTINRTEDKRFPSTICGVVYAPNAFEWTKKSTKINDKKQYERAKKVANKVLSGKAKLTGTEALYFKAKGYKSAFHSKRKHLVTVGNHEFYK